MTRYIGVDLHTNTFTCCFLQANNDQQVRTFRLQRGGLEDFIACLETTDEVAVEATGNSTHFYNMVLPYVSHIVVVVPWQFKVIRRSVKKTDKHDARSLAFFLSKDMLPDARIKSDAFVQLSSLITTHDQLKRLRVSFIGKVHGMFVRHGLIENQIMVLWENMKQLEQAITTYAKTLPEYENLISIKGVGSLSAAVMLTQIGDISDFKNTGKLATFFGIIPKVSQSNDTHYSGRILRGVTNLPVQRWYNAH